MSEPMCAMCAGDLPPDEECWYAMGRWYCGEACAKKGRDKHSPSPMTWTA